MNRHPLSPVTDDVRLGAPEVVGRRCACRGWIFAPDRPTPEVGEAVALHQAEEPHRSWNRAAWVRNNTAKVDVPIATLRKVG